MPSRAVYTALAVARSDTGCSTVLIPWVEEPVMVTPEVVGHFDPSCPVEPKETNAKPRNRDRATWRRTCQVPLASYPTQPPDYPRAGFGCPEPRRQSRRDGHRSRPNRVVQHGSRGPTR